MIKKRDEQKKYSYIKNTLENLYQNYGYEEITIPMLASDKLYEKYGGLSDEKKVKMIDRDGNVLVIRPDATFNVLMAVKNFENEQNEKYFYNAKVFRAVSTDYREDEINQCGVECFSKENSVTDSDVIALAINSLKALEIEDIRVDLGHADFVYALIEEIEQIGKKDEEKVHKYIEQKNRIDLEAYLDEKEVGNYYKEKLIDICMLFGDFEEVMDKAKQIAINDKMENALVKIEEVYKLLLEYGLSEYVYLDLGFTNPLNYYSGIIFKIYSLDVGNEVITGGRYDRLSRKFAGKQGACGFAQDLDRTNEILTAKKDYNTLNFEVSTPLLKANRAVVLVQALRGNGYNVSLTHNSGDNILLTDKKTGDTYEESSINVRGDKND